MEAQPMSVVENVADGGYELPYLNKCGFLDFNIDHNIEMESNMQSVQKSNYQSMQGINIMENDVRDLKEESISTQMYSKTQQDDECTKESLKADITDGEKNTHDHGTEVYGKYLYNRNRFVISPGRENSDCKDSKYEFICPKCGIELQSPYVPPLNLPPDSDDEDCGSPRACYHYVDNINYEDCYTSKDFLLFYIDDTRGGRNDYGGPCSSTSLHYDGSNEQNYCTDGTSSQQGDLCQWNTRPPSYQDDKEPCLLGLDETHITGTELSVQTTLESEDCDVFWSVVSPPHGRCVSKDFEEESQLHGSACAKDTTECDATSLSVSQWNHDNDIHDKSGQNDSDEWSTIASSAESDENESSESESLEEKSSSLDGDPLHRSSSGGSDANARDNTSRMKIEKMLEGKVGENDAVVSNAILERDTSYGKIRNEFQNVHFKRNDDMNFTLCETDDEEDEEKKEKEEEEEEEENSCGCFGSIRVLIKRIRIIFTSRRLQRQ